MSDKSNIVHVFTGKFDGEQEATAYTRPQWEPEPGEDVSDEEYEEWEDRNPSWALEDDLGVYLDEDFVETICSATRYEYLQGMLVKPEDITEIKGKADTDDNTLVLVFQKAIHDWRSESTLKSTKSLRYCGNYDCKF